jgi:hypothetical protein
MSNKGTDTMTASGQIDREEVPPVAIVVMIAILGGIGYGLYRAGAWFIAHFGFEGVECIAAGTVVLWATEAGVFYLLYRWSSARAKQKSLRNAVAGNFILIVAFLVLPLGGAGGILVVLHSIVDPGEVGLAITILSFVTYMIVFVTTLEKFIFKKHPAFLPNLFCSKCSRHIKTDDRWSCGDCGQVNMQTRTHSFLQTCDKCGSYPSSYECPHAQCRSLIRLGIPQKKSYRLSAYPAKQWVEAKAMPTKTTEELARSQELELHRKSMERSLTLLKAHHLDAHIFADAEREWMKKNLKRNSTAWMRHEALIEAFMEEQLAKTTYSKTSDAFFKCVNDPDFRCAKPTLLLPKKFHYSRLHYPQRKYVFE